MSKLEDTVAVVTGASKGIGAAIAKQLAAEGAAVVVNYVSSKDDADRVVGHIASKRGKAIAVQADVSRPAEIRCLFAETKKAFGRLDILVNNAGVYEFAPLEDVTEEHFHKQFNLNVLGLILASREAARYFDSAGGSNHQHQLRRQHPHPSERLGLQRHQGGGRCRHQVAGQRAGPSQHPSERHQSGHGGNRRRPGGWPCGERLPQTGRGANPARPDRPDSGHCARRGLPRLSRCGVDHGRNAAYRRRPALTTPHRGGHVLTGTGPSTWPATTG
jgi:hypothetical protein